MSDKLIISSFSSSDQNVIPAMQESRVGEPATFTCVFPSIPKGKSVDWYWNNILKLALTLYYSDSRTRDTYRIQKTNHGHAGVYECRVTYFVARRKEFTVSGFGQLRVTGTFVFTTI